MLGLATSQVMQMPGVDLQLVMTLLLQYFVASLRIGAFLLSAPLFGARWLPLQVRVIMAFSMGAPVVGLTPTMDVNLLTSSIGIALIFIEIAVGLTAGLTLTIWFAAMLMAGEKIATSAGLGFAAQVDPMTGSNTPVVSQILYLFLLVINPTQLRLSNHQDDWPSTNLTPNLTNNLQPQFNLQPRPHP